MRERFASTVLTLTNSVPAISLFCAPLAASGDVKLGRRELSIERPREPGPRELALRALEPETGAELGEDRLRLQERCACRGLLLRATFDRAPGEMRSRELERLEEAPGL